MLIFVLISDISYANCGLSMFIIVSLKNESLFLLLVLVRSVRTTSHACNFQDMWKRKSVRPTTSRKAGYAPVWGCNGLKNFSKGLPDVREGGLVLENGSLNMETEHE